MRNCVSRGQQVSTDKEGDQEVLREIAEDLARPREREGGGRKGPESLSP